MKIEDITLKAINKAIAGMKGPYDYRKTAAILEKASIQTQSSLAALRKNNKQV